ncbi:NIPSNAP family protein [Zunongwangia sp. F363]|uniref:NIPSNAP family protein n=1 Tax=Autumnicola tepida TaxID=3075595 RepID=A0ABU3C9A7_9FLAO|nr:NIPSNAP family protein [Zunongwangia sp. F363]MDT0642911.1 NIPSNAP family protein [Zunongwangia sp. F363]
MKKIIFGLSAFALLCCFVPTVQAQEHQFYQLKIYSLKTEEQVQRTDAFLEKAYLPALAELGIDKVGVFKPKEESKIDSLKHIYVLLPFSSLEQWENLETNLNKNQNYRQRGSDFLKSSADNSPYSRFQSILLKAFQDHPVIQMPSLDVPRKERVYELRSYQSPTGKFFRNKLKMFNEGGEVRLFDELGFNAVFYGEVISGPEMPNLMYMTTFADQESRDKHWEAFSSALAWKALSAKEEYADNVSHIDITFLYPTDYSAY